MTSSRTHVARLVAAATSLLLIGAAVAPAANAAPNRVPTPKITSKPAAYTASTSATFAFTDTLTTAKFQCQRDKSAWTTCVSPVTYSGLNDGAHKFSVRATATGKKTSFAASATWTIDRTPPNAPTVTQPATPNTLSLVPISFSSSSGDVASFRCSLDGASFATCTSPRSVAVSTDGYHTFSVRAVDRAGNLSAIRSVTWARDTTTPTPVVNDGPASLTAATTATFEFSSTESGVTFACRIDGGAFLACAGTTKSYSGLGNGAHTFAVRATDALGNTATSTTYAWTISPTAAVNLAWGALPEPVSKLKSGSVGFTISGQTTIECKLDNVVKTCATSVAYSGLADGKHTVTVTADKTLASETALTFTWTVDTTAPAKPTILGPSGRIASTSAKVTVLPSNPSDATTCTLDGVARTCDSLLTPGITGLSQGSHTVVAVESDVAGNTSSASRTWVVDTVGPTATVVAPTSVSSGGFVSFTEAVKSVSASTIALTLSSGASVPHTVTCLTAAGSAVSCSATTARKVRVNAKPLLVPGEYYKLRVTTGVKDLAGNAATATTFSYRAPLTQQESSAAIATTWRTVKTTSAKGGSYVREHRAGATASYSFKGTAITWYTVTGRSFGRANVYVDGVKKASVNNYTSRTRYGVARTVKGLANRSHVLKVVVTGKKGSTKATGVYVALDAVKVGAVTTTRPALVTTWSRPAASGASGGRYTVGDIGGQVAQLTFRGTSVKWLATTGRTSGKAAVYIDGVLRANVDLYASSTHYKVARTYAGLSNARHTVKIVVLGKHRAGAKGNRVSVDAFVVS